MTYRKTASLLVAALLSYGGMSGTAWSAQDLTCVVNSTSRALHFTIENWGSSLSRELEPKAQLCLAGQSDAQVVVAEYEGGFESCEENIRPLEELSLIAFNTAISCIWDRDLAPSS